MVSDSMRIVSSFSTLFVFLYLGHVIREKLVLLRRIMLPASLIGGILALIFVQLTNLSKPLSAVIEREWVVGWSFLPGFLINIVFATLFLGTRIPSLKEIMDTAAPQICYGWFLAFGNWTVACFLTGVLFIPVWKVNKLFSTLGPVGFTGGHGTAGGLKETYTALSFPEGGDLALTCATIGILSGVVLGTLIVNIANHSGWTYKSYKESHSDDCERNGGDSAVNGSNGRNSIETERIDDVSDDDIIRDESKRTLVLDSVPPWKLKAIIPVEKRVSCGEITVSGDAVETLALHLCFIALSLLLSYGTKRILILIEGTSKWLTEYAFFSGFPLFPLCLLWGLVIQLLINRFCKDSPISRGVMERIGGTALDILVLSAIAKTNLATVADQIAPLLILCLALITVQILGFFLIAPRMLPDFWTERACAEFGVATATTSIGLMLLRSIDPEFETPAAKSFAAKQLFTEPLLGGGIVTSLMLPLIASLGNFVVAGISFAVMIVVTAIWFFLLRNRKLGPMTQYKFALEHNRFI